MAVTKKKTPNSFSTLSFSFFSKAQYLFAKYLKTVTIVKEIATKMAYFTISSLEIPSQAIKKFKIIKSKMAKKAPVKRNFANW